MPTPDLLARVRVGLAGRVDAGARVVVALSGGRDSTVLLDALARLAPELGFVLSAAHVHHGLSPNAQAWADHCGAVCARLRVPLAVLRVDAAPARGESPEARARAARYAALRALPADVLVLAHHQDDQAETVLLQLLRGAGPAGLAAMPAAAGRHPLVLRPLLGLPRSAVAGYAAARELAWVEDESNDDPRLRRNFLRREVLPMLEPVFPGWRAALARSAAHCSEAAAALDELARLDAAGALSPEGLRVEVLRGLSPARARNLLRHFLALEGLPRPSTARLAAWLDQLSRGEPRPGLRLGHAGARFGLHAGRLQRLPPTPAGAFERAWLGETSLALDGGALRFRPALGEGISARTMADAPVVVRSRRGGERLRPRAGGPSRSLKLLFQEAGVAAWLRPGWPLVFVGGALAEVPGVARAAGFACPPGEPGWMLEWSPDRGQSEAGRGSG